MFTHQCCVQKANLFYVAGPNIFNNCRFYTHMSVPGTCSGIHLANNKCAHPVWARSKHIQSIIRILTQTYFTQVCYAHRTFSRSKVERKVCIHAYTFNTTNEFMDVYHARENKLTRKFTGEDCTHICTLCAKNAITPAHYAQGACSCNKDARKGYIQ